jgi:hypothetical protein
MSTPDTFIELITAYRIEIPLLQREYAQGRSDQKTTAVRKRFVKELFAALTEGKCLELDFIYGPIKGGTFIPLDGQQRLTTLFLLHWYIAKREQQGWFVAEKEGENRPNFKEFTYKVRTTTQEFLDALLNPEKGGAIELHNGRNPAQVITDAAWYYSAWNYDPSVQGMLTMLDAIHHEYGSSGNRWDHLKNITFRLLNMGEYGLSDDLYMKMNARGVPLTDFENFKAWLEQTLDQQAEEPSGDWKAKLDKEWADFFWSLRATEADEIDAAFLRFFKAIALNAYAEQFRGENIDGKEAETAQYRNHISRLNKDEYIPLVEYSELYNLTKRETIAAAFSMLDNLATAHERGITAVLKTMLLFRNKEEKIPLLETLNNKMFSYSEQLLFFGMYLHLGKKSPCTDQEALEFKEWMRVVRNLVLNSQIDNPQTFVRAIKGLKKLYDAAAGGILGYLASPAPLVEGFRETQINEEIQKAKLIVASGQSKLKELIQSLENHPLFRGRIDFILKKESNDGLAYLETAEALEIVERRKSVANLLWNEAGSAVDEKADYLLFRSMLATDCRYEFSWQKKLYADQWKELLEDASIVRSLLLLMDEINPDHSTECIRRHLSDKIDHFTDNISPPSWKWHLVKNGDQLLKQSRSRKIQQHMDSGIFIFNAHNASCADILISEVAEPRNKLITKLINAGFKLEQEGRKIELDHSQRYYRGHDIYYRGHDIALHFPGNAEKRIQLSCRNLDAAIQEKELESGKWKETSGNRVSYDDLEKELKAL